MKEKRAKLREHKKVANDKLLQKQERLRLIDEENEKQRKKIIKKIKNMEKKKEELDKKKKKEKKKEKLDKQKEADFLLKKEEMTMKILNTIDNRNNLEVEEKHKRDEVLEYENIIFNIVKQKQEGNEYQRALSQSRTLQNQKENQFKLKEFKKIMNSLQDESICNKNDKQRRIMYNEKVKKELEEKRKEEEKRLEKMGII